MRFDVIRYAGSVIIADLIIAVDFKIVGKGFCAKLPVNLVIIKYAACKNPLHLINPGIRHQQDRTDIVPGGAEPQPDHLTFHRLRRYHIGRSPIAEQGVSAHPEISFSIDRFIDLFRIAFFFCPCLCPALMPASRMFFRVLVCAFRRLRRFFRLCFRFCFYCFCFLRAIFCALFRMHILRRFLRVRLCGFFLMCCLRRFFLARFCRLFRMRRFLRMCFCTPLRMLCLRWFLRVGF